MNSRDFLIMQEMIQAGCPPPRPRPPAHASLCCDTLCMHMGGPSWNHAKMTHTHSSLSDGFWIHTVKTRTLFHISPTTGLISPGTVLFGDAVMQIKTRAWRRLLKKRYERRSRCFITPPQHHNNAATFCSPVSQCVCMCGCGCLLWVLYYRATCFLLNISSLPPCTQQTCSLH